MILLLVVKTAFNNDNFVLKIKLLIFLLLSAEQGIKSCILKKKKSVITIIYSRNTIFTTTLLHILMVGEENNIWILFSPASISQKPGKVMITGGRGRGWRKSCENQNGGTLL